VDDVRIHNKRGKVTDLDKFKIKYDLFEIYYNEFGEQLSDSEIEEMCDRLINLFYILL